MNLTHATTLATRLVELFTPHCIIVNIAGSIRRQRPQVKDIELVALPRYEFVKTDLFGNGEWRLPKAYLDCIDYVANSIVKGQPGGRYMQIILKGGATLDLFTPQANDYYRQLAMRTGSADYARGVLATQWQKLGWCGTHDGLRLIAECVQTPSGWKCIREQPTLPPAWESEEEFFTWLQLTYTTPNFREYNQKPFLKENL